ncbi:MAG: TetR/AcrR family transcriptional regulator [Anaerolineae bacterium]|nr:TetR/AcrR family transcriptional regulator [Anaerolineae bacterium]
MDWKEKQKQIREEAILDHAHELLMTQTYTHMSMDELASRVGISKATLYQHFPSKEELAVQVCLRGMQQGETEMKAVDPTLPALRQLEMLLRQGMKRRAQVTLARYHMMMPEGIRFDPRIKAQHNRMGDYLSELIEKGKTEGDIRPGYPTPVIVRMMMSFFGPYYEDLIHQEICTAEELGEALISILLNGISTHKE